MPKSHDPGGKVKIPLKDGIKGDALFSSNKKYRYRLSRTWDPRKPKALFVLMNPSTADKRYDDRTVAKCLRYAQAWEEYGGILVANVFAYRCTDQRRLGEITDPVGPDNNRHIREMAKEAKIVIFAYGKPKHKGLRSRGLELVRTLTAKEHVRPYILRLCKDGTPRHPLYLRKTLMPVVWAP